MTGEGRQAGRQAGRQEIAIVIEEFFKNIIAGAVDIDLCAYACVYIYVLVHASMYECTHTHREGGKEREGYDARECWLLSRLSCNVYVHSLSFVFF